ncbi:MAG: branched-chain amino acid ABC transporter permease [Firmicutes bacterium]|nr:branched-chain amino acid ABC transporter permease [Bacillota bacterium]
MLLQQTVNGLSIGSVYALIAVGYSLIYSILQFSNFAHGSFLVAGAYAGFFVLSMKIFPMYIGVVAAFVFSGITATVVERLAYRPIRAHGAKTLYFIIASMGISIFCENFIIAGIGPQFRTYPPLLPFKSFSFGEFTVGILDIVSATVAIVFLALLQYFIARTKTGMAIRAAAFDLQVAGVMGVNVNRILTTVFFIAGFLAGIAGVVLGVKYTVYPQLGYLTIKAFVAAIFGGLGSLPGAIVGSLLLGLLETYTAAFVSTTLRDLIVFFTLILVLLFRPNGIMGIYTEEKV